MMKLFKRKQKKADDIEKDNIIADKLGGWYAKAETAWAQWMSQRTASLTKKDWLIALIVFGILTGGYNSYLIIDGLSNGGKKLFSVSKINSVTTANKAIPLQRANPGAEYENIKLFHKYMDSLYKDAAGRKVYDSIIRIRPGLMDSIKQAENYYQQLKNR